MGILGVTYTYTKSQEEALRKIKKFILDPSTVGTHFVLSGSPGTGKTFITSKIAGLLGGGVAAATISHAAKLILAKHLPYGVKKYTLAGILGLKAKEDRLGNISFEFESEAFTPMSKYDYIILDEVSMIDDKTYDLIMNLADKHNIRIIAIGDEYQLPPVEQDNDSKFFNKIDAELVETMRYAGPIHDLATTFRKEIKAVKEEDYFDKFILNSATNREDNIDVTNGTGYRFYKDGWEMLEEVAEHIKVSSDIDDARVLAFKNKTIDAINSNIRGLIYGKNLQQFEKDEIIIVNNNVIKRGDPRDIILYNGQILKVKGTKVDFGPDDIPCVYMEFYGRPAGVTERIFTVATHDGGEAMKLYNKRLAQLRTAALKDPTKWRDYYNFINQFMQYDYAYSVNLYRSQGSTIKNAYVLDGEVLGVKPLSWKQKFQALYVAITRASQYLTFYNESFT